MNAATRLTARQTLTALREGSLTVTAELTRVAEYARRYQRLNALYWQDEKIIDSEAAKRAQRCPELPLAGIPVVVKDNIDVAGMPSSLGTQTLADEVVPKNAGIVDKLQQAGALVVAKGAMHELASGTSGLNAARGDTLHPFLSQSVAGGSSSGCAVAVAAGIVPISIGTDTGASVRLPAAFCGLSGFRPSLQTPQGEPRYPQQGIAPISVSRDTAGIIAREVADIILTDSVISGDSSLPAFCGFDRLRLGVPANHFWEGLDHPTEQAARQVLRRLSAAGVTLVSVPMPDIGKLAVGAGFPLASFEMLRDLPHYLTARHSTYSAGRVFSEVMSEDVRTLLKEAATVSKDDYHLALREKKPQLIRCYQDAFSRGGLDGLIFPTVPILPPSRELANGLFRRLIANCEPATVAGLPCISLPLAETEHGVPVGIEIQFQPGDDRRLLVVASAIEQLFTSLR